MTQISKEYATALFMLAKESGREAEIAASLEDVTALFAENPEYVDFLASPCIPKAERIDAVEKAFGGRIDDYVTSFVQLLCERGHITGFADCAQEYGEMYRASMNTSVAEVTSAVTLTDEEKIQLKQKLEKMSGRSVILECRTDASLMGGIIVRMDGKVLDGSLKHRLYEVKEVISK